MKFKFVIALAVATVFTACKKEDTKATGETPKTENGFFSVDVETSASKTDDFALYYTEDNTINFKDVNAIWMGVKGGKSQTIQFRLSNEIIPTDIRLDFGMKKDQDSVIVKNIKVSYYGNSFQFNGADFFKYFEKSDQFAATVDSAKGTLLIVKKGAEYKTPFFYPTTMMIENIKKITSEKK